MFIPRLRLYLRSERFCALAVLGSLVVLLLQLISYDDLTIMDVFRKASTSLGPDKLISGVGSGSFITQKESPLTRKIILPAGFNFDDKVIRGDLEGTASANWPIVRTPKSKVDSAPGWSHSKFVPHEPFTLFHSNEDVPPEQCSTKLNDTVDSVLISPRQTLPGNITYMLELLLEELDEYNDSYYSEISPVFLRHLRVALKKNMINSHWFRLSGSSVWLKDHRVHLLVSRLLFSEKRTRNDPKVSFVLVQVFDKNWNELKDVRLVFPTNDLNDKDAPGFTAGGQRFHSYRFPRLLPVPFYNDYGKSKTRYLGPEDPRIIMIKNEKGYEEPLAVFNAGHHEWQKNDKGEGFEAKIRSMFMCRLFQLQKGKGGVEVNPKEPTNNMYYARTDELVMEGVPKPKKVKNWTPMLSENDRQAAGYDKSILFITQFSSLNVLKCDLVDNPGRCSKLYAVGGDVSELRGGTPLLNANTLLKQANVPVDQLLPPGREVFVGFARAHLTECGCGSSFYRPNLVVLVKDEVKYEKTENGQTKTVTETFIKLSHVSGFMSLHVPIDPWFIDRPYDICEGVNALIPNGVSDWKIESLDVKNGHWRCDDRLSVSFSVSDFSVDTVDLSGVFNALLNSPDHSLFLAPPGSRNRQTDSFLKIPQVNKNGGLKDGIPGYNNINIDCAIEDSKQFCQRYAVSELIIAFEHKHEDSAPLRGDYEKKVKDFEAALKKAPQEKGVFF